MITFFDPKRGAELEQEVIEQRLLINSLIAKVDCLESTISNMHSIHANDVNNLRASIERLTYTTRLSEEDFRKSYVGMQSGIPIYSMDEMREQEPRPSAFYQCHH